MIAKAKKTWRVLNQSGFGGLYRQVLSQWNLLTSNRRYQEWISQNDTLTNEDLDIIWSRIEEFSSRPLISVLMPVYNVDEKWLRQAIDSVRDQVYPHWELCIADDCSTKSHVKKVLEEYAALDPRIKPVFRNSNGHISAASSSALELASGEYTALLDHDDELARHALFMIAAVVNSHPLMDMIYSDEDMMDRNGRRHSPKFKPDWSPDLLHSMNFVNHLSVYRTSILKRIGGFRVGFEGSQDYDLALRFSEQIPAGNIFHIPHVLYHWRAISGSVALGSDEKAYAHARARDAINEHFERKGVRARSTAGFRQLHRVAYEITEPRPLVSVIAALAEDVDVGQLVGILEKTNYEPFELLLISKGAVDVVSKNERVKVLDHQPGSHFAMLNSAVRESSGSVICFVDGSTNIRNRDWLSEVVGLALRLEAGAVGGKVVFPDERIKHAGLILGINDGLGRAHYGAHKETICSLKRLHVARNVAAVSSEFLIIRKDVFESIGGFDAENFPETGADIDLCLTLREKGFPAVWTPWAEIVQTSMPRVVEQTELEALKNKWGDMFDRDPYFNRNLSNESGDFSLSFPPRLGKFDL